MATDPQFSDRIRNSNITLNTANAATDGTGTIIPLVSGAALGSRIDLIKIKALTSTTTGLIRIFQTSSTTTPTWRLFDEIPVTVQTANASATTFSSEYSIEGGILLSSGWTLGFTTSTSQNFTVTVIQGGDF